MEVLEQERSVGADALSGLGVHNLVCQHHSTIGYGEANEPDIRWKWCRPECHRSGKSLDTEANHDAGVSNRKRHTRLAVFAHGEDSVDR